MIPVLPLVMALASALASTETPTLRVGIWMEASSSADSSRLHAWAETTVETLNRRLFLSGLLLQAHLELFRTVSPGALPLAGGDAHHHPDLRATGLDLLWGVRQGEALPEAALNAHRTWLVNAGCLDERGFNVGWDLFKLPDRPENRLAPRDFPIEGGDIHRPSWSLLSDSVLPLSCRRALQALSPQHTPLYSDADRLNRLLDSSLSLPMAVSAFDGSGRPAVGAILEIWRGRPDPRRPYAGLFEGAPDTIVADDSARLPIPNPKQLLCGTGSWVHGRTGSCGTAFWRLTHAHRSLSGWLDAGSLLSLADSLDTLRLAWSLPGGSTSSWKEASEHWPRPWLAAESDSSGTLTLGLSVPSPIRYVLRIVDDRGNERLRSQPMFFQPGVYEKRLEGVASRPIHDWDVRLDAPSSRLQARIQAR